MERPSAPRYDLFKLLITIALIVILLLMLLRGCATLTAAPEPTQPAPATPTGGPVVTEAEGIAASNTSAPPTPSTNAAIIATPVSSSTPTAPAEPSPTTLAENVTATPTPAPIEASAFGTATATPAGNQIASCKTSVPSRLSVGQSSRVVQRLNMRSQPLITAPILRTNAINTEVDVFGGPICTPVGEGAYLWWQIRLADGTEGWSAESPLNEATYLLEPIP